MFLKSGIARKSAKIDMEEGFFLIWNPFRSWNSLEAFF